MKYNSILLKEKLRQYSLLTVPALATAGMANAQIVYQNIEPDQFYQDAVMGDNYTEPIFLDLDNDGVFDLKFAVWSSVDSNNGPNKVNLAAVRQLGANGNAIMGYTNIFSASICSTPLPLYCPSALNENEIIEAGNNFWAIPGSNSLGTLVRYFRNEAPPNNFVGQWNNQADKYIGFRFTGGDGNMHYGWMRLDVSKSPASITLKDYAYQSEHNASIRAGEMGNVGIENAEISSRFAISHAEGLVHVMVKEGNATGAIVTVCNLLGQPVITQSFDGDHLQIDLRAHEAAVYLVTIYCGEAYFSAQVTSR